MRLGHARGLACAKTKKFPCIFLAFPPPTPPPRSIQDNGKEIFGFASAENGKTNPTLATISKLAKAVGVSTDELLPPYLKIRSNQCFMCSITSIGSHWDTRVRTRHLLNMVSLRKSLDYQNNLRLHFGREFTKTLY